MRRAMSSSVSCQIRQSNIDHVVPFENKKYELVQEINWPYNIFPCCMTGRTVCL